MWEPGEILKSVEGFHPVPAPWDPADRAGEARLHDYLQDVIGPFVPLPSTPLPLFLHLHVALPRRTNLAHGFDLERFLTPLFGVRWLPSTRFVLVTATKSEGEPARIAIGLAAERPASPADREGHRVAPAVAAGSPPWVEDLRRTLSRAQSVPLPEGPVLLQMEFACSPDLNWVTLWRPAGEAMGPVLGYDRSREAHHPLTDRLAHLEYHRRIGERRGVPVEVHFRWSLMPPEVA
jgi:hypothetical protein